MDVNKKKNIPKALIKETTTELYRENRASEKSHAIMFH